MEHRIWNTLCSYAAVAALACLMGVSYELFVFPNAFAPAGINGLATMLQYLLHINIGYLSLLINLPLVLLAWKKVDRDFARKTLVFVLVFSAVTLVLGQMDLSAIAYDSGSSAILGPVAAGVVSGAVYGWVIRQNGSTGGTDIIAAWVRKKHPEASLVWLIFSLNAAVAVLSFFVYGCQFEPVILCLIYCYLSSSISDTILKGGKSAMKFEVVTRQPEELSRQLMQQLRHGVVILGEELVVDIHQLALADGGGRLLARHIRRAAGQVELADAHADGAGGDENDLVARVFQIAEHLAELFHPLNIQSPRGMRQRGGSYLDRDSHGTDLFPIRWVYYTARPRGLHVFFPLKRR